jgi:3-methyl-2-oxobutanoate hydroxymethyltransferase
MMFYSTYTQNIVYANEAAISVTDEETIYYTIHVVIVCERALVIADMLFTSYKLTGNEAFRNAGRMIKETGCLAVKLESMGNVTPAVYT